jgi:1,2-dihydroxy-3-keto-5-methylthiopentene dioxygenase
MKVHWLDSDRAPASAEDLRRVGVLHEVLPALPDDYQPQLDVLKRERGYVEQDIVELRPDTAGLDSICAKFADEHLHTDDEVRYVLEGEGVFDIRSTDDAWIRVTVERGDLLVVPANLHHRFFLTERKHIRCLRLFKDSSGWVPHYRQPSDRPNERASERANDRV